MNIDAFKSVLSKRNGLAVQNRFSLNIAPPSSIVGTLGDRGQDISILCDSCTLPGRTINTLDYQFLQNSFKIPNGFTNDDVSFTFLLTNDYYAKNVFDTWLKAVVNPDTYRVGYAKGPNGGSGYTGTIIINQLTKSNSNTTAEPDRIIHRIRLDEAFPTVVSGVALDNTAENSIQKLNVTVAYKNFTILD